MRTTGLKQRHQNIICFFFACYRINSAACTFRLLLLQRWKMQPYCGL